MSLLYGFKTWNQQDALLTSMWAEWVTKRFTAKCDNRARQQPCKKPPGWDCTCGIYTYNDLERTFWHARGERNINSVLGLLALSGRVIGHREGMRAQHAEIVALWAVHNHDQLAARYGVEVLVDPFEFQRRCRWLIESERRKDELSE